MKREMKVDIEWFNGYVVENKYYEGSTFVFLLPISADLLNTNKVLKEDCINFQL